MDPYVRKLMESLTQEQKGLIAHIYNNHLAGIIGNVGFALEAGEGRTVSGDVKEALIDAKSCAERMARETHLITRREP